MGQNIHDSVKLEHINLVKKKKKSKNIWVNELESFTFIYLFLISKHKDNL